MARTKTTGPPPTDDAAANVSTRVHPTGSARREMERQRASSSQAPPPPQQSSSSSESGHGDAEEYLDEEVPDFQDTSLLASYTDHIARDIWQGKERGILAKGCNRVWRLPLVFELPEEVRLIVDASGLAPLVGLTFKAIDKCLLSSFVERWYSDTNTFHLPVGEMTITLDDVSSLLHIPVTGRLLPWSKPQADTAIEAMHQLLGVSRGDAIAETRATRGGAVRFHMLEAWYEQNVSEERWEEAARCFLLCLVGSTLFLDKSMTYVGCHFLGALEDVHTIQEWGWGACALTHMYDQLSMACL